MRGRATTVTAAAGLLALAWLPFVVLFPDPPAFGPEAVALLATDASVATLATAWRGTRARRRTVLRWAAVLCGASVAAALTNTALHGALPLPTLDGLPLLFGLGGEEVDDAVLYERWCELWLLWAVPLGLLLHRYGRERAPANPWDPPPLKRPWNGATILLFAVGCGALVAAVVEGHRTAAFLRVAARADGVIANDDAHPLVRFTAENGTPVTFVQNGGLWRAIGDPVPVVFDPADPAGTAEADTFFVVWGNAAGFAWVGLGFTLFPFIGIRAAFGRR